MYDYVVSKDRLSCLIIGGAGFIGSHLVNELLNSKTYSRVCVIDNFFLGQNENLENLSEESTVRVFRADATDLSTLLNIIEREEVDRIFNLGVVPLPNSLEFPMWSVNQNIKITLTACEAVRLNPHIELVNCSSSEVYGTLKTVPMNEDHPCDPETPYAGSKLAGDTILETYVKTFGIKAFTARPFNNYGPRQNTREYKAIFPAIAEAIVKSTPIAISGSGRQTRDFVFVEDTVKALNLLSMRAAYIGEVINIGTGEEASILHLIDESRKLFGESQLKVMFVGDRTADVFRHIGSNDRLFNLTQFRPRALSTDLIKITLDSLIMNLQKSIK
jgi:UDP-glucose 4-epimerase